MLLFMFGNFSHTFSVFLLFWRLSSGFQIFSTTTLPTNLTSVCSTALLNDINCSPIISALQYDVYYPVSTLNRTCTAACGTALSQYEASIASSCVGQSWVGYDDTLMPLTIIAGLLRYQYNLTCLVESGRYCNNVAAASAFTLDPGGNDPVTGGSVGTGGNATGTIANPCDLCFIKSLQFQAGSPFFNGPLLADQSVYESKTASCGITNMPLTTTDLAYYTPTTSVALPSPTCSGTSYAIQPSDNCHSISKAQGISTGWLMSDNNLQAYCAEFPTTGTLCLANKCGVYTVEANDTCTSVAAAHSITEVQFKAWNPMINAGCYNLANMIDTEVCISSPGRAYVTPTVTLVIPTVAVTAAPVPTDVAVGTNIYCGKYYQAVPGDFCNMIVIKFGIKMDDFIFLNPAINENCTNLFAFESYCVMPVGDVNTYTGKPGATVAPTGVQTTIKFSDLPDVTTTSVNSAPTGVQLADGTRSDCTTYFLGDIFQASSISGTSFLSTCALAASTFYVDLSDFGTWNTDIGNTSLATCAFKTGFRYCGKLYFGEPPQPPAPVSTLPIRAGATSNCTEYEDFNAGNSCQDFLDTWTLTIAQFFAYNPAVLSDCTGLWTDYQYCVRDPSYVDHTQPTTTAVSSSKTSVSTKTTSTATSTTSSIPGPTQTGISTQCSKYVLQAPNVFCFDMASTASISLSQLYYWNPALNGDCSGMFAGYAYCVGISPPNNAPVQVGVVATCEKYVVQTDGVFCFDMAAAAGISLSNLYAWNPALNGDCSGLWAGYAYCVASG